jgi:hypothetical protein
MRGKKMISDLSIHMYSRPQLEGARYDN